jgi:hypothetical protein
LQSLDRALERIVGSCGWVANGFVEVHASQVTAVVSREVDAVQNRDDGYVVALRARLVEPYFVRLAAPSVEARIETERRAA